MKFFTSDLHFGSDDTIMFDNRPFKNSKAFINFSLKTWNEVAKIDDVIYVIGDFVDCHSANNKNCMKYLSIVKKIRAKIILILGNNEKRIIKNFFNNDFDRFRDYCLNLGFQDVKSSDIIEINNTKYFLVHKPKDHNPEMLNLFGHSHKAMGIYKSFGFNIGCDLNNYRLYSENDISNLLSKKINYWDKDQNLKLI